MISIISTTIHNSMHPCASEGEIPSIPLLSHTKGLYIHPPPPTGPAAQLCANRLCVSVLQLVQIFITALLWTGWENVLLQVNVRINSAASWTL